jgi:hypothetical protein
VRDGAGAFLRRQFGVKELQPVNEHLHYLFIRGTVVQCVELTWRSAGRGQFLNELNRLRRIAVSFERVEFIQVPWYDYSHICPFGL